MKHVKVGLVAALLTASLTARAQEAQKVTFEPSGWLVLGGFQNRGQLDANELPRYAISDFATGTTQKAEASGFAARQSRLRFALTVPTDNFLAGATLKGLVEADFVGGAAGTTVDGALPRLRHAYMAANWKAANLTLLVGQTWGVALPAASGWATSLSHLAVPRFGGAGFLYRRAPQIRLSGEVTSGVETVSMTVAALTAGDIASAASNAAGNQTFMPNFEGRLASSLKVPGSPLKALDVGVSGHWGQERYTTNPAGGALGSAVNATSLLASADVRLDFGYAALIGAFWKGQNLDNWASVGGVGVGPALASRYGVLIDTTVPGAPLAQEVKTKGAWAQLQLNPVKGLQGVIGMGFENPDDSTLALLGAAIPNGAILRNTQYSAGLIWSVTSKWRLSFEATRYLTFVQAATPTGNDTLTGNQFEIGSLLAL